MIRHAIIASLLLGLLPAVFVKAAGRDTYKIKTVVIDAGHGGHDAGCLGASSMEKHVALDIALALGKLIENNYPDVKVVYTRKTDVFIPLHERANIANRAHADVFICIHLNSGGKAAYGSETYVMGNHKSQDNLEVAKRENQVIQLEDDYLKKYDGFDPNSPEANIIFSLYQSQYMSQSLLLASNIQDEFEGYAGRYNRGVKQAGFLVLYKTAMPAVLIECGFLSNQPEEKFLSSGKGQQTMATAIYRAFKAYKSDMESAPSHEKAKIQASTSPGAGKANEPGQDKSDRSEKASGQSPKDEVKQDLGAGTVVNKRDDNVTASTNESGPVEATAKVKESTYSPASVSETGHSSRNDGAYYTIQVGATQRPEVDGEKFKRSPDVIPLLCNDGFTRYLIGQFKSEEEARKQLAVLKSKGLNEAFLTAINGNSKISLQDAARLIVPKH